MNKVEKIATGAAAVAAGAAAAVTAGAVLLTKTAIDRQVPKPMNVVRGAVAGGVIDIPEMKTIEEYSKRLTQAPTETVSIESRDGLKLAGHWYPAEAPKRIVIAMHGWRSTWHRDFGVIADFLHQNDCSLLMPEQRGQDGSDGEYIGFGVLERYDCVDWINYVLERFGDALPIYLCGISMGATTVLMASGLDLPQQVHGILADCGFTSPHAEWAHVMENNLHINERLCYPIINLICNRTANFDGDEVSTVDALRENRTPVLFVHGADDKFVPVEMTYENFEACAAPKTMLIVEGAGHGMSYFYNTEGYREAVLRFFKENDSVRDTEREERNVQL